MLKIFFVNTCKSTMQRGSPSEHMGEYMDSEVDAGEIPADNLPKTDAEQTLPLISLPNLLLSVVWLKAVPGTYSLLILVQVNLPLWKPRWVQGAYILAIWSHWCTFFSYLSPLHLSVFYLIVQKDTTGKSKWYLVYGIISAPILMEEGEEGAWTNKLLHF